MLCCKLARYSVRKLRGHIMCQCFSRRSSAGGHATRPLATQPIATLLLMSATPLLMKVRSADPQWLPRFNNVPQRKSILWSVFSNLLNLLIWNTDITWRIGQGFHTGIEQKPHDRTSSVTTYLTDQFNNYNFSKVQTVSCLMMVVRPKHVAALLMYILM
jgi:hypothetical protein